MGSADSLRGGNSGGVTILVSFSIGIIPTIDNVIVDHYAQTVTLHPPQWEMPLIILASYVPPIGPRTDETIFQDVMASFLLLCQATASLVIWIGDLNFRIGKSMSSTRESHRRCLHAHYDFPTDCRSTALAANLTSTRFYIEMVLAMAPMTHYALVGCVIM